MVNKSYVCRLGLPSLPASVSCRPVYDHNALYYGSLCTIKTIVLDSEGLPKEDTMHNSP